MKVKIAYMLLAGVFTVLSWLPLGVLYLLSDFVAWLAHSVVRYRRRVVRDNLASSFPDSDEAWLRGVERGFYRFLADYFVETVKLTTMSRSEMRKRMRFEGLDMVDRELAAGRSCSLYLGHYCNWEWISSIPMHIGADAEFGQIYHPLENEAADRLFLKIRSRFGATSIPMDSALLTLRAWHREGRPNVVGYIADQIPTYNGIHLWLDFLHHDTAVFTGAERLSRMFHASAFYIDITRPRRGYYVARVIPMTGDAATLPAFDLTRQYFSMLEHTINARPQYWLWSHRRWKRTRKGFMSHYGDNASRRLDRL